MRAALVVGNPNDPDDSRLNDLASQENGLNFLFSGYHNKDYNIYLWALLEQIDQKLADYNTTNVSGPESPRYALRVFPNPNRGRLTVQKTAEQPGSEKILVIDLLGRLTLETVIHQKVEIELTEPGVYFILSAGGIRKVVVH